MSVAKKKLLYIASRPFLPVDGGRERMLAQYMNILTRFYIVDLVVFSGRSEVVDIDAYEKRWHLNVFVYRIPHLITVFSNLFFRNNLPFQVSLYLDKKNILAMKEQLSYADYDVVIADMARTAPYILDLPIRKKIVDFDDLLSLRYERLSDKNTLSILGTYSKRVPHFMNKIVMMSSKILVKTEALRMKKWEMFLMSNVDGVIFTSPKEASVVREYTTLPVIAILPAVDCKLDCKLDEKEKDTVFRIGFLGNMRTIQNQESLIYIVDSLLPIFERKGLNYQLVVIGGYDETFYNDIMSKKHCDKIIFKGFVSDMSSEIATLSVLAAPIFSGTGIKTKILEAMSCYVPVITTELGCEGLNIEHEKHILVANSDESFYECIDWIMQKPDAVLALVNQAFNYLKEFHSEDKLANILHDFLEV